MRPSSGSRAPQQVGDLSGDHFTHRVTSPTPSVQWDLIWKPDAPLNTPSSKRREETRSYMFHLIEEVISEIECEIVEGELIPGPDERKAQRHLSRLQKALRRGEARLLDYAARVSAFNVRLPYEVINMILGLVVFDSEVGESQGLGRQTQYDDTKLRLGRIGALRLVCPHWNAVITSSSEYWASALYELPVRTSLSGSQWRDMCLALDTRRSTRPLHLVLHIGNGVAEAPALPLPILPPPEPRLPCSSPELATQMWQPLIDQIATRAAVITLEGTSFPLPHPPSLPTGLVNLKRLVLINVHFLRHDPFYLCGTPNLEELRIDNSLAALPGPLIYQLKTRIHLASLKVLSYRATFHHAIRTFNDPLCLLFDVAVPALQRVTLSYSPGGELFHLQVPIESVRHLTLGPYWRDSPTRIVAALPSLEELEINGLLASGIDVSEQLVIGHFLGLLSNALMAPKLKTLVLRLCVFSQRNLLTLLRGWQMHDCLKSRHVTFLNCHIWGMQHPKHRKSFVKAQFDLYGVDWVWRWENRQVDTIFCVKVDVEDHEAGEQDYERVETGDELGEFALLQI